MSTATLIPFPLSSDIASLFLRLIAAAVFVIHGWPKVFGAERQQMKGMFIQGGMPGRLFDAIGILEVFGGIFLVVGFLTPLATLLFAAEFVGILALLTPRMRRPPMNRKFAGGWEIDMIMFVIVVSLFIVGPGQFSVDNFIGL
ncbi:MAG: DoxX family protein [Thaumarchaeota archaeon]|nr:DoxX family protein [Nitrososphaerota archaeon]